MDTKPIVNGNIPFGRPTVSQEEIAAVVEVLSGPTLVHGTKTTEFETKFAERAEAPHAVAVSSCTAALHLSLLANDIGPGDEVLVPAMTHVATAHAVEFCGARPIFVDVEPDTGNIDTGRVAEALTPRTKAIMVVHYLGLPCAMHEIMEIAERAGAIVIEDCALSVDATFDGRKTGNFGVTGCFSFYPIKHMTTIEGGMAITNDATIAGRIAQKRAFGYDQSLGERRRPGIYDVTALGYNYRMNEVEAAIGLIQLGRLDKHQQARQENFIALYDALSPIDELSIMPPTKGKAQSSHYCLNVVLPQDGHIDRDQLVTTLKAAGIGTSVHYPSAVPLFSYYRDKYDYRPGQFPVAEWLAEQAISFPVGPHLSAGDATRMGDAIKNAVYQLNGNDR